MPFALKCFHKCFSSRLVPSEIWRDVLQSLTRFQLDAAHIVNRAWRSVVEAPNAPARRLDCVTLLPHNHWMVNARARQLRDARRRHLVDPRGRPLTDARVQPAAAGAGPHPQLTLAVPPTPITSGVLNIEPEVAQSRSCGAVQTAAICRSGSLTELAECLRVIARCAFISEFCDHLSSIHKANLIRRCSRSHFTPRDKGTWNF